MPAKVNKECCIACGTCEEDCPTGAIKIDEYAVVDENECIECGRCVEVCPQECITI
ncbi:ferredoxin [Thermoplasmatales archaeon ex4484_30]|nr:MAG: ferredoxin [Thermoplasmatales archaeon ex4484_30]RLF43215.1 MAG: ferredoxin [Thermoplasmata archaeon]